MSEYRLHNTINPPFDLSKLEIVMSASAKGGVDPMNIVKDDDYGGTELDALIEQLYGDMSIDTGSISGSIDQGIQDLLAISNKKELIMFQGMSDTTYKQFVDIPEEEEEEEEAVLARRLKHAGTMKAIMMIFAVIASVMF